VLDPAEVRGISLWATEGFMPQLTILLDLDETVGRERLDEARTKYDRLEAEKTDFHARVRASYLALAAAEPERFLVLPATDSIESIAAAIRARVQSLLGD
jgi:dTMP kinase